MKMRFTVENGAQFLTVTFGAIDREILDKQCSKLGLSTAHTTRPLGTTAVEPVEFYRDARSGQLARVISASVTRSMVADGRGFVYNDDINAPLYTENGANYVVNIGLLRFKIDAETPFKVLIGENIISPEAITNIGKAMTAAMKTLASIVFEAEFDIIVRMGNGAH